MLRTIEIQSRCTQWRSKDHSQNADAKLVHTMEIETPFSQ